MRRSHAVGDRPPGWHTGDVRGSSTRRLLAIFAAVWVGAYLGVYLNAVNSQGSEPADFYLVLLALALALLVAVAIRPTRGWAMVAAVVVIALCAAIGAASVGVFLAPALLLALAGVVARPSTETR